MGIRNIKVMVGMVALSTVLFLCYILLGPLDLPRKKQNVLYRMDSSKRSVKITRKTPDVYLDRLGNTMPSDIKTAKTKKEDIDQTRKNLESKHVTKGSCIGLKFPVHLMQEDSWSPVDEAKTAFVFSAYVVDQTGKLKVVGASTRSSTRVICQYWLAMSESRSIQLLEKQAAVHLLPETHDTKYAGAIFDCPASTVYASYVSLVTKGCNMPLNLLKVKNGIEPESHQRRFTVCLKPLHFQYGRENELVEWIEFNLILGAEKFIVYNYSTTTNTAQILEHYVKKGLVEVVQWNLPIRSYTWPKTGTVVIHSMGMLPMLQDCLLRSRPISEFVVNIDVDEFIVPHSDNIVTWSELLTQLPSVYDTYLFRHTFFRKEWNNSQFEFPGKVLAKELKITSLQILEHEAEIWAKGIRSKYFTRTNRYNTLMIHEVVGRNTYVVPIEKGLLHHYRNWQRYNDNRTRAFDDTVWRKYGEILIDKIGSAWKEIRKKIKLDISK